MVWVGAGGGREKRGKKERGGEGRRGEERGGEERRQEKTREEDTREEKSREETRRESERAERLTHPYITHAPRRQQSCRRHAATRRLHPAPKAAHRDHQLCARIDLRAAVCPLRESLSLCGIFDLFRLSSLFSRLSSLFSRLSSLVSHLSSLASSHPYPQKTELTTRRPRFPATRTPRTYFSRSCSKCLRSSSFWHTCE